MCPKRKEEKLLTDAELEWMNVLWKLGEGTVNEAIASLPAGSPAPAYTTVSTILRILEQKSFLRTRKEGRGHVYIPSVPKAEYEARTIDTVVERVFDGEPLSLARQLVRTGRLSAGDLAELRALLEGLEKGDR